MASHIPDLDHFRGSFGGKHVIPLWRDVAATEPNIADGLLDFMTAALGHKVEAEDLFAYTYAILAAPSYTGRFREELMEPGSRVPLTRNQELFAASETLGRKLVALHTYGERWAPTEWQGRVPAGEAQVQRPIPHTARDYPEEFGYDAATQTLSVGAGTLAPVSPEVWTFSVSGLVVLKSWLSYRMKEGAGRTSSDLDRIRPTVWSAEFTRELLELIWVLQATVELHPELDTHLSDVIAGPLIVASELPTPTEDSRQPPKVDAGSRAGQGTLGFSGD